MRTIPGMVVISPADDLETREAVKAISKYKGPVYMRLGRLAVEDVNDPQIIILKSEKDSCYATERI